MAVFGIQGLEYEGEQCPERQHQLLQVSAQANQTYPKKIKFTLQVNMKKHFNKEDKMCLEAKSDREVAYSSCKDGLLSQGWERNEEEFEWNIQGSKARKFTIKSLKYNKCLAYTWEVACSVDLGGECHRYDETIDFQKSNPIKLVSCAAQLPSKKGIRKRWNWKIGKRWTVPLVFDTRLYWGRFLRWHPPRENSLLDGYCLDASGQEDNNQVLLWGCKNTWEEWKNNQQWKMETLER